MKHNALPEVMAARSIIEQFEVTENTLPVDIESIAMQKGVSVIYRELPDDISGVLDTHVPNMPVIIVNINHSKQRQRFSIAHELGHYILHTGFAGLRVDKQTFFRNSLSEVGIDTEEIQANRFAAELLMPQDIVQSVFAKSGDIIDCDDDTVLRGMAQKFDVSLSAMSIRIGNVFGARW